MQDLNGKLYLAMQQKTRIHIVVSDGTKEISNFVFSRWKSKGYKTLASALLLKLVHYKDARDMYSKINFK